MRSIKRRSIYERLSTSNVFLVFLVLLAVFLIRVAIRSKDRVITNDKKMKEISKEINEKKAYSDEISRKVDFLSTDEGAQSILRSKYLGVREGESVAVIVKNENSPELNVSTTTTVVQKSFWQKLSNLLPF
jgi:ATP/ADP translocase